MMFLTDYIFLGFIRFFLIVIFLYYLNSLFLRKTTTHTILQFIVNEWFKYGAITLLILFILIEFRIYNLANFLLVMGLIILTEYIVDFKSKNPLKKTIKNVKSLFSEVLGYINQKKNLLILFKLDSSDSMRKDRVFIFWVVSILVVLSFLSKYYFIEYDTYLFSDLWISDLETLIKFNDLRWFEASFEVDGELALANLYSKIVGVSPEVALQSITILETTILSLIIFWTIRKITLSEFIAPLIAFGSFCFLYFISPIEIHYLLQNQPVFLSLTFIIPAMVFTLKPELLNFSKINYLASLTLGYIAVGLLDLFSLIILILPFYLLALLVFNKKLSRYFFVSFSAYILALGITLMGYYFYSQTYSVNFEVFIQSSIISVDSFTYMPNLKFSFEQLLFYFQLGSLPILTVLLLLTIFKKEAWRSSIVFLLYFNVLIVLFLIKYPWVDIDLLRYVLAVFIPIFYGISAALLVRLVYPIFKNLFIKTKYLAYSSISVIVVLGMILPQIQFIKALQKTDHTPRDVLKAYQEVYTHFFPYSYAVVNDQIAQTISTNKHFFQNYSDFLITYLESDSIYHANRKDPKFPINHPDKVIPKSILVFVYDSKHVENDNYFSDQYELEPLLMDQMEILKKRGRSINCFFESPHIRVYEIVNEPKQSRLTDLIF